MESTNPYLLRHAMLCSSDNEGYEKALETDRYDRQFCTKIDGDRENGKSSTGELFNTTMKHFKQSNRDLNQTKLEFRRLLLFCLHALLEDMIQVKQLALNKATERGDIEDLNFTLAALGYLDDIFQSSTATLQFVLVPSLEFFCVYVSNTDENYVRMKIPEYARELNIMQEKDQKKELVLQCRHSYTGKEADLTSQEKQIFKAAKELEDLAKQLKVENLKTEQSKILID